MSRPFRLRNCCEIVQPLRGAELLNREVRQLESSIVVARVLKVPEVLEGILARRIHTGEAADWFDHAVISEADGFKIASGNARRLLRLWWPLIKGGCKRVLWGKSRPQRQLTASGPRLPPVVSDPAPGEAVPFHAA